MVKLRNLFRRKKSKTLDDEGKSENETGEQPSNPVATVIQRSSALTAAETEWWKRSERLSDEVLGAMTDGFSVENFLGSFQFGKVYRGQMVDKHGENAFVTVKIWNADDGDKEKYITMLRDEIFVLSELEHPYLPKVLGFCRGEVIGIVYNVEPYGILETLVDHECLEWDDRLHIALRFALVLQYLHDYEPFFLVRNISTAHIILDKAKNPILYDFGMLIGGILHDERSTTSDALGHIDPLVVSSDIWCKACDVYAYGGLLLALLRSNDVEKCVKVDGETWNMYKQYDLRLVFFRNSFQLGSFCFIHHRLYYNYDAHKISRLAIQCHSSTECERPSMAQVIQQLNHLFMFSIHKISLLPQGYSVKEFTFGDLETITNGFSPENFIGQTQFGDLYKGKIDEGWKGLKAQAVTVKVLRDTPVMCRRRFEISAKDKMHRLKDEMTFLLRSSGQQNLPKLSGFCCENGQVGVVYELETAGRLCDFLAKDSFQWVDRVRTMHRVSRLLQFLHNYDSPYIVGNISSHHFLFDKDMQIVLVEFGMLTGGILGGKKVRKYLDFEGAFGYIDGDSLGTGQWNPRVDVYAYGVLLVELLSKKHMMDGEKGCQSLVFALREMKTANALTLKIVDDSLKQDSRYSDGDADEIIKVVSNCGYCRLRFTMNDIVQRFQSLELLSS